MGDVGCEPRRPDVGDERFGVVVLVTRDGPSSFPFRETIEHGLGAVAFGVAGCRREVSVDDQPVAVFDQDVPRIAEPGSGVVRLPIQHRLRVGRRFVGVVRPFLPVPAHLDVAALRTFNVPGQGRGFWV